MAAPQLRLLATAAHLVGRKSVPFCQLRRRKSPYSRCLHAAAQGASWSPSHPRGHRATQCCGAGAQWWLLAGMHGPQLSVGSKFGSFTALSLCNGRAAEQESCQQRCGCAVPMPTDHHKIQNRLSKRPALTLPCEPPATTRLALLQSGRLERTVACARLGWRASHVDAPTHPRECYCNLGANTHIP